MFVPFINQDELVLDEKGKLVVGGKIVVEYAGTNIPANIFTYNPANDEYVVAENPIYLNGESRTQHTYFTDKLVQCRLYKYIGNFANPMVDDDTENWSFVRDWLASFDVSSATNDTIVHGLYGIKEANPELGNISVIGYWDDNDCEIRTYYWDAQCVQTPDEGYIIKANGIDTGRWILKFDGEYLPSTYYGVYPGREANINALLTYVDEVGTEHFKTAPGVYFVRGEYTASTVSLVTQKKLLVDCDTRFSRELIQCADIKVVGTPNHYICDFMLNGNNVGEVHSSWFKTVTAFWGCDAKTLYIDQDNNFANTVLQNNVELNQQNIIGGSRIPMTYAEGKRLQITNCNILGKNLWNSTDQIRFYYSYFKDEWFSDPANIDFVNKVNVRTVGLNKLILDNFSNVQVYVNACRADGQTSIDLQDRKCSSLNLSDFNDVRNVQASSVSLYSSASGGSYDVTLRNSNIDSLGFSGRYLSVSDSDIGFNNQPSASAMWFENTKITGYTIWTVPMQVECDNCWWGVTMNYVTDNNADTPVTEFKNTRFQTNVAFTMKRLRMENCVTDNNTIKIYPYKDSNDVYHLYAYFKNNSFNSNTPIEFTRFDTENGWESKCYECEVNWTFVGNSFAGNDEGIRCRYWANRAGSYYNKTFIADSLNNVVLYKGNTGKCPLESPKGYKGTAQNNDGNYKHLVQWGSFDFKIFMYSSVRCMTNFKTNYKSAGQLRVLDSGDFPEQGSRVFEYESDGNWSRHSLNYIGNTWFGYKAALEVIDNGDLFEIAQVGTNDKAQIRYVTIHDYNTETFVVL
jgi:hypothetical protein